jgi:hypothetical protein
LGLDIGRFKWLRLFLIAVGIYLVLLPVWLGTLPLLASAIAQIAGLLYGFFDPAVNITSEASQIAVSVTASQESGFGGQVNTSSLRLDTITYAFPMLIALILVTRADSWLARLKALGLGMAVVILLTILATIFWGKMTSVQLDQRIATSLGDAAGDMYGFLYVAFHGYAFSQPVIAVAVWIGLMTLGVFKVRKKEEAPAVPIKRNALCSCGSGRKYKRCCGKT